MGDQEFVTYIQGWIQKYGTAGRLADAIGMTLSAFSRGFRHEHTLGIENCLRFAAETGESPSKVLRLAGKGAVADLLEQLYGPPQASLTLSGPDRELLELWHTLSPDAKPPLLTIIRDLQRKRRRKSA